MFGITPVNIVPPTTIEADWISATERSAATTPPTPTSTTKTFNYTIAIRGTVVSDFAHFRALVAATLNDSRGWPRANIKFQEVNSGGHFAVFLQEPAIFANYAGCDVELSCRHGNNIMINDDRWRLGTDHWTTTGLPPDDYRRMIINHEVGHWLGHRHITTPCASTSIPMPLMIDSPLRPTCAPNIWPLPEEIWISR